MLKPLTYFRRNILELPSIHCSSSRANCTEHQRSDEWLSFAVSKHRTQLANRARALCDDGHRLLSTIYSQGSAYTKVSSAWPSRQCPRPFFVPESFNRRRLSRRSPARSDKLSMSLMLPASVMDNIDLSTMFMIVLAAA